MENKEIVQVITSLSAAADKSGVDAVADAMLAVRMDPTEYQNFNDTYYPTRTASGSRKITRLDYAHLTEYITQNAAAVNRVYNFLRLLLSKGDILDAMDSEVAQYEYIHMFASSFVPKGPEAQAAEQKLLSEASKKFVTNASSGTHHILVPEGKGYKIVFVGSPESRSSIHPDVGHENLVTFAPVYDDAYQQQAFAKYKTKLSIKVLDVISKINALLGISADKNLALTRQLVDIPISNMFFNRVDSILLDANFIPTSFPGFFADVSPLPSRIIEGIGEISKIVLVVDPCKPVSVAINARSRLLQESKVNTSLQEPKPLDVNAIINDEAFVANPNISFSFSVSLPENVCRYVTQTPEDKDISLFLLHTWVRTWAPSYIRNRGGSKVKKRSTIARYVMAPSSIEKITELRKSKNYHIEEGKVDESGIYVSDRGTLRYAPKASEISFDSTRKYEADMEAYVQASFSVGSPIDMNTHKAISSNVLLSDSNDPVALEENIKKLKDTVREYSGEIIAQNWDYSTIISVSDNGSRMEPTSLENVNKPDSLVLADYLGYSFDEGGDNTVAKTFAESVAKMIRPRRPEGGFMDARDIGSDYSNGAFADLPFMSTLFRAYQAFVFKGTVPNFKQLLEVSAKNLGLTPESFSEDPYEKGLYTHPINGEVITKNMSPGYNPGTLDSEAVRSVLQSALKDSYGDAHTNLRTATIESLQASSGPSLGEDELYNAIISDKHYFSSSRSKMFELNNVYNYLGGQIFYQMCKVLADMPAEEFLSVDLDLNRKLDEEGLKKITFSQKSDEVKPLAIAFAKYVPNYKQIFDQATALSKSNTPETDADVTDIAIPGIKEGSQAFPHQVNALGSLSKHPKFAILDVDPGGGKTITILADVMSIIGSSPERIKPLLIAPDGLAKNWANDLNKIVGNSWNVIPITNKIVGTKPGEWSFDDIDAVFSKMPKNTIVVAGINFLKSKMFPIVIGNNVQQTSAPLELIKRHGFNYIALDESHKAKNPDTNVYKVLKSIMSSSSVKYIRLATGTLISNNLKDVVGQTSLYSSHVFRTPEEFEDDNTFIAEGSSAKQWFPDGPLRARKKLARHASVITIKRKEWAFMLPTPVETFEAVSMAKDDTPYSDLHIQMYNAVLDSELGKLQEIINKRAASGNEDDEEDTGTEGIGGGLDLGTDEADIASLGTMLTPFLARLERILTDPLGDVDVDGNKFGAAIFAQAGVENFVPRKVKAVIKKINEHFNTPKWTDSDVYKELETVEHKGNNYLLRKLFESPRRQEVPNAGAPDVDVDSWKHEPKGKVLVFCRYTRSVNAIYDALPPEFKSIARRFTGDEGEAKWRNLEEFKGNDDVQILIANEQAITEGHNLQMASRLIRVESPWAPGELEQSQSRIFRPDPDAAKNFASTGKPGELYREAIYLDWIVSNDTLEIQKMGRLISKMIDKTKFDEIGNPRYKELEDKSLPPISMSMEMLQEKWSLAMISGKSSNGDDEPAMDYIPMYSLMQTIRSNEFTAMRKTKKASMLNLKVTPMFKDAEELPEVPYLPDQEISDTHNYGLVGGSEFLANKDNIAYKITPDLFKGKPVHTSKGNGIIVSVLKTRSTGVDENGNPIPNMDNPISSIRVKLKSTGKTISLKPSLLYIANNITEERMSEFSFDSSPTEVVEDDEETTVIEEKSTESAIQRNRKRNSTKSTSVVKVVKRARKRKRNVLEGKPVNSGIEIAEVDTLPPIKKLKEPLTVAVPDRELSLDIGVYNGYLAMFTGVEDPDAKALKRLGFVEFGDYAYVIVKTKKQLYAVYDFLEDEKKEKDFELTNAHYVRPMNEIAKSFESGAIGRAKFSPGLAPLNTLKNFFLLRKKLLKNKKILRVYPVVLEDSLMLCIDLFSNPAFRKYKNATIPGLGKNGKWKVSQGMMVYFSKDKASIRRKIKEIVDAGFTISNKSKIIEEFKRLKPRKAQINKRK